MPADPAQFAALTLSLLVTYLLHSTCLLAGAGIYFRLRRTATAAWRSRLWKVAATAGFFTAPAALCFSSAAPGPQTVAQSPAPQEAANARLTVEELPIDFDSLPSAADQVAPLSLGEATHTVAVLESRNRLPAVSDSKTPASSPQPAVHSSMERWKRWAGIIGLTTASCALLVGLSRISMQSVSIRRRFRDSFPLTDGPAVEELARLMQLGNLHRPIRLLASPSYAEPVAFGLFRWHIVLPEHAEADLSRGELRSLLAHELAHLVRRDAWWLCVGRLLCTAFAYQPLNFWARRQWQHASEFLCDEWAVCLTGDRLSLAKCLTTVAEWRIDGGTWAGSMAATGQRSMLSARVEKLIGAGDDPPSSIWRTRFLVLTVAMATCGLAVAGPTATFALSAMRLPNDETVAVPEMAVSVDSEDRALPVQDSDDDVPTIESEDDVTSLRIELAALREELLALETLIAQQGLAGPFQKYPARIHARITDIETKLAAINHSTSNNHSTPGVAGGRSHKSRSPSEHRNVSSNSPSSDTVETKR